METLVRKYNYIWNGFCLAEIPQMTEYAFTYYVNGYTNECTNEWIDEGKFWWGLMFMDCSIMLVIAVIEWHKHLLAHLKKFWHWIHKLFPIKMSVQTCAQTF
jgi:hypothetical protein